MQLVFALAIGALFASGVHLVLRRDLIFVAFGIGLLGGAINLLVLATGRVSRMQPAFAGDGVTSADVGNPIPQAFVLTAIVIGFAMVTLVLALARRSARVLGSTDPDG